MDESEQKKSEDLPAFVAATDPPQRREKKIKELEAPA